MMRDRAAPAKRQMPLPNEPYLPPSPPENPAAWDQAQWDAWWKQMVAWCLFRESRTEHPAPPLAPPPPLWAARPHWQGWLAQFRRWEAQAAPTEGPIELPPFPAGWAVLKELGPERCLICGEEQAAWLLRSCPQCGKIVCRPCLSLSRDRCPVDDYAPVEGQNAKTRIQA